MNSLKNLIRAFGSGEKLIFFVLGIVCLFSGLYSLIQINKKFLVEVPVRGGLLSEGMIGSPRFINPVLAISDTDKSIVKLVYSGLVKLNTENEYEGDLAESISISEDGLTYYLKIRDDAEFHNGKPITADDVIFTIDKILDPIIKSPKRTNWEGVTVEKLSDKEIQFVLKKAYFPFLENLTIGILPKHIWQTVTSEEFPFTNQNINPVGSGPYRIKSVKKNNTGLPTEIVLKPFKKYISKDAYISEIKLVFFQNENTAIDALNKGNIIALGGISPINEDKIKETINNSLVLSPLPRIFGAFFNQNQAPVFANKEVRLALDTSIDKNLMTQEILYGFGVPLKGPTPYDIWEYFEISSSTIEEAKNILNKNGWTEDENGILEKKVGSGMQKLSFSISTSDVPDLKRTAEILRDTWTQLGADISIKIFETSDLSQNIIKTRKYDMLLFGEVVGRELDLYPFWHSSERNDPGLNISLYTNITADKLLNEIRSSKTTEERNQKLLELKTEIEKDIPAVFLYAPHYIYTISNKVKNVKYPSINSPADRFSNISEWYIDTAMRWKIFVQDES